MGHLGAWLGTNLIPCASVWMFWVGCRGRARRLQSDALCHHVESGSATWAVFERDFAMEDVGEEDRRRAMLGAMHVK